MRRNALIQLSPFYLRLILLVTFCHTLSAMHHNAPHHDAPRRSPSPSLLEIVVSDDHGLVERIPTVRQAFEHTMSQWMMRELMQQNKELQEQLAAQKKKWYVITAGIATTVIPLVIVCVELYKTVDNCE